MYKFTVIYIIIALFTQMKGWEFALWFLVRIARVFFDKKVNCTFALRFFCKERQEQSTLVTFFKRARRALNLKEHRLLFLFFHPNWYDSSRKNEQIALKIANCSCVRKGEKSDRSFCSPHSLLKSNGSASLVPFFL